MTGIQLTERDLDILAFLLQMKFATVKELQHKFFRKLKDGKVSNSEWYARERMRLLWKHGLVETVRFRYTDYKYFIATDLAFEILSGNAERMDKVAKPIRQIDIRTFEHDAMLMKLRLHLEDTESVKNWKSERVIKRDLFFQGKLARDYVPDAVYENEAGETVAYELERTMKSRKDYREKIGKYVRIVRKQMIAGPLKFDKARFVCATPRIAEALKIEARIFNNTENPLMTFELLKDVFGAPDKDFRLPSYGLLVNQYT
jgi:hypothetical protein